MYTGSLHRFRSRLLPECPEFYLLSASASDNLPHKSPVHEYADRFCLILFIFCIHFQLLLFYCFQFFLQTDLFLRMRDFYLSCYPDTHLPSGRGNCRLCLIICHIHRHLRHRKINKFPPDPFPAKRLHIRFFRFWIPCRLNRCRNCFICHPV